MLGAGALGRTRGMVWGGRREEGSGWGTQRVLRKVQGFKKGPGSPVIRTVKRWQIQLKGRDAEG